MAKPIQNIEEILLLKKGVTLAGLEAAPMDSSVREFQRRLGGGQLCEELHVFDFTGAEQWKNEFSWADAFDYIDNLSGLASESVSSLWPLFSHGDGHTFYYYAPEKRFVAHYHDPDTLESIGTQLFQAINAALDANFHFIPEDFSPVYWKPSYAFSIRLGATGRSISPEEFFAATEGGPTPSHTYCGSRRGDLIWLKECAHVHYVLTDVCNVAPFVDARFYYSERTPGIERIEANLERCARKLALDIYRR